MRSTYLTVAPLLILAATAAFAQDRAQDQNACGRDAARLCKKVINDGDFAILACLKENRDRLRPVCIKHLQGYGQL